MIKHLIFDFDGTISDSYPHLTRVILDMAQEKGIEVKLSADEVKDLAEYSLDRCFRALGMIYPDRDEQFHRILMKYYLQYKPFPQIEPLLQKAISKGMKNHVYTHTGSILMEMLQNMGLDSYFTFLLHSDLPQGFPRKPAPDALNYMADHLGLNREECLMIGDRDIDTMAGNRAGMKGCLWDAKGRYTQYQTDYKVSTLEELTELLDHI